MTGLAFYKGDSAQWRHRVEDDLIRAWTRGPYSHVEMVFPHRGFGLRDPNLCWSASGRDGGVRCKVMPLPVAKWDVVQIDIDRLQAVRFFQSVNGARYDYLGLMLSHVLPINRHDPSRWHCSEICAAAMNWDQPHRYSPNAMARTVGLLP